MNGVEFENFYKKFNLKWDFLNTNNFETNLLYRGRFVCSYYKNPESGERFIRFPGKWLAVKNFDNACKCFEKYCRPIVKEIQIKCKLDNIKKDF